MKPKILIVDDEKPLRDTVAKWLRSSYECLTAPDATVALEIIKDTDDLSLLISDIRMPGEDGLSLVQRAKKIRPGLSCILLTAYGTIELAVSAMKEGADDFFQKPITDLAAFELRIQKVLKSASLERENAELKAQLETELEDFTGNSSPMKKVYGLIRKVAPTNATVLIEGPTGTGKELVARALHRLSPRAKNPMIAIECASLSKELLESELFGYGPGTFTGGLKAGKPGCFEAADGGTLFLDEIGEIDLDTQVKLLRTLETRTVTRLGTTETIPVDFRLITATNRDLVTLVRSGLFREDLYYRLNVIDIKTPALKDHREDIAPLIARFLKEFSKANGHMVTSVEPDALKLLEDYAWPGNVRELRNIVEKMVILSSGEKITRDDLPVEIRNGSRQSRDYSTLAEAEKSQILSALETAGGNKSQAANALGISRRTLHRKLKEWNIS